MVDSRCEPHGTADNHLSGALRQMLRLRQYFCGSGVGVRSPQFEANQFLLPAKIQARTNQRRVSERIGVPILRPAEYPLPRDDPKLVAFRVDENQLPAAAIN
jgi:hypothetical protein